MLGLTVGADDYITKPFNPIELQARVKSQLRRYMQLGGGKTQSDVYSVGGIVLNPITKEVTLDSDPIALTRIEYNILLFLMQHVGQSFTPREIYQNVWPVSYTHLLSVILEACNRTVLKLHHADFKYTEGILSHWNEQNVRTLQGVEQSDLH